MKINIEKKQISSQFIFSFSCENKYIDMLLEYNQNLDWEKIYNRKSSLINKSNFKSGKSFCPKIRGFTELKEFNLFNRWLEKCFSEVVEALKWDFFQKDNLKITQSWLNKSETGETHHLHRHSFSLLSGILYLSNKSSTQFFIPSIYALPNIFVNKKDSNLYIKHNYLGEKGELIIFPSSLEHCVGPNLEKEPRISLSINTWPSGNIGSPKSLAFIPQEIKEK
tara:strand:+ start:13181 stop:13849 length:669 start_codon:yes stop_codon:yes gene_type:complete